jgi:hypothetical protein
MLLGVTRLYLRSLCGRAVVAVEELHQWHLAKLQAHHAFERVPDSELVGAPHAAATQASTIAPLRLSSTPTLHHMHPISERDNLLSC